MAKEKAPVPPITSLTAIAPIDGRYWGDVYEISQHASEQALIRQRLQVEVDYLLGLITTIQKPISPEEIRQLQKSYQELSVEDAQRIKDIETEGVPGINGGKKTDHDVKALEFFLRDKFKGTSLQDRLELFHFGLTSEDVNNIAYTRMLKGAIHSCLVPAIVKLEEKILGMASTHTNLAMLGRTHGQPAIPTTVGKEFAVFGSRIAEQLMSLAQVEFRGKLNGAVGNYSSFRAAHPEVNWPSFSETFIRSMGLKLNPTTTQIESHDNWIEAFNAIMRLNTVLVGFNQDMWGYISDDYIMQRREEGTVGSSTMPQKINPIKFENSEGNLLMANALFEGFARKLPISRFQRDLSDSTVSRWVGTALAASLLAYKNTTRGLGRIEPNYGHLKEELDAHWEVLAEPIQQILRREGVSGAYDMMKNLTQGKKWTEDDVKRFARDSPDLSDSVRREISILSPHTYIGLAPQLTQHAIADATNILRGLEDETLF